MCYFIVKKCRLLFISNKKRIRTETVASIQFNQVCECTLFSALSVVKGTSLPTSTR